MTDDNFAPGSNPFDDAFLQPEGEAAASADSQLEAQLVAAEAQLAEQKDKLLRLAAEYDNFRKRSVRERQEAEARGMSVLVRGILDELDDLGRFAHVDPATTSSLTLQQGVEMIEKKLLKSLAGHGLELVNPVGQPFDPAVHEAVTTMLAATPEEDHLVAQVFQVGYVFNGQLLRPARVVVKQWKDGAEG
ncbi:MAG TPA: nucleotide exchange factor GrpE [Gemmatimonadaceae bacterium]|jgi:molecular chaperone GrpE